MAKIEQLERALKLKLGKKCFNCGKKSYYAKDCCSPISNKRKPEKSSEEVQYTRWKKNQAKVVRLITNYKGYDLKIYLASQAVTTRIIDEA